jgi:hypothetical protein
LEELWLEERGRERGNERDETSTLRPKDRADQAPLRASFKLAEVCIIAVLKEAMEGAISRSSKAFRKLL